jgi:hypothetical protein
MVEIDLEQRENSRLDLVGSFVEVRWTSTHVLAKRQCQKCVYLVRGFEAGMACIELVYDAIDGEHKTDSIYWVETSAIQYLRVLSKKEAHRRIDTLERELMAELPRG